MKVLRPHDQIVLPVHTETIKATENVFNLLLRMCTRRYLVYEHKHSIANSQSCLIGARYQ